MPIPAIPPSAPVPSSFKNLTGQFAPWGTNDVAVYLSAGQSNSYGHNATMATADRITTPLTNVFTLATTTHQNTTFTTLTWEGLTSLGKCNLGMTNTDHLNNSANEFARLWQAHIDAGNAAKLPNLYVVLMGTGGRGFFPGSPLDAWSFTRDSSDVNSLYPRYIKTIRMVIEDLKAKGFNPRIVVQNWNQWEAEADSAANNGTTLLAADYAAMHFQKLIAGIRDAVGCPDLPFDFYYPLATTYPAANIAKVKAALDGVVASDPMCIRYNDARRYPGYTGVSPAFGVFLSDNVHYSSAVQKWFGQQQFDRVIAGNRGVVAGRWPHGSKPAVVVASEIAALQSSLTSEIAALQSSLTSEIAALQSSLTSIGSTSAPTKWSAINFTTGTDMRSVPGLSFDNGASNYTIDLTRTSGVKAITATKTGNAYGFMRATAFVSDALNGELVADVQSGSYPQWLGAAFRVSSQGIVGGGFQGIPFSYIGCNLDQSGNFNVWVLWNSSINITRDRRLTVPASSFARPVPTGAFRLRIRLIGTTVFLQSSTDGGVTWLDMLTSDNTTAGTAGKTFTFAAEHSSLTNVQTNGGVAGFIMGLGTDSQRTSGLFNSLEFNPLP